LAPSSFGNYTGGEAIINSAYINQPREAGVRVSYSF
jgi:hypothetical protein